MGWEQLKEIIREHREENAKPRDPNTCPECAFALRENEHGDLLCPICGWRGKK